MELSIFFEFNLQIMISNVAKEFDVTRKTIWAIWKCDKDFIHLGKIKCYVKYSKVCNISSKGKDYSEQLEPIKNPLLQWGL